VGERYAPQAVGEAPQVVLPPAVGGQQHLGVGVELVDGQVDDAVDQAIAVGEVVVERHGLDVELAAQAAHGQRGQTVAFDQPRRRCQDRRPVQPLTGGRVGCTPGGLCPGLSGFAAACHLP